MTGTLLKNQEAGPSIVTLDSSLSAPSLSITGTEGETTSSRITPVAEQLRPPFFLHARPDSRLKSCFDREEGQVIVVTL